MGLASSIVERVTGRALAQLWPFRAKAVEGEYRPGPYVFDDGTFTTGTWDRFWNFWQLGKNPLRGGGQNATAEACINAYAQTIGMLPAYHKRKRSDGGEDIITSSPLARILRQPNEYQTRSDFHVNLIRCLFYEGNGYAAATLDGAGKINGLHMLPPEPTRGRIDSETGEVWYTISGNPVLDAELRDQNPNDLAWIVPMAQMLHVRHATLPNEPLKGITPLSAAMRAMAQSAAIQSGQAAFFANMSRPSGLLSTEQVLTREQIQMLRERWEEQSKGVNAGRVPVLGSGMKWQPLTLSAAESQMIEQLKWTSTDIMRALRVPPMVAGDMSGSTWNNAEQLIQFWLSTGLQFVIINLEEAYNRLFKLPADEYVDFDEDELARPLFKDRIEGLVRAVQGGVLTINEAREIEGRGKKKGGDEPRVQQQVVPLSAWAEGGALAAPKAPATPPAAANDDVTDDGASLSSKEIELRLKAKIHAHRK